VDWLSLPSLTHNGLGRLRVTPAMAAGVSKTVWSMDDTVKVVEEWEAAQ
jgi:hypothetical protein